MPKSGSGKKTAKPGNSNANGKTQTRTESSAPRPKTFKGVPLLQHLLGKASPNYAVWFREALAVGTLEFGEHMCNVMKQIRFKPGQKSRIRSKICPDDDSVESDAEAAETAVLKANSNLDDISETSDSDQYECSSSDEEDSKERKAEKKKLKKKRLIHWEKKKIKLNTMSRIKTDDIIKIRTQDPQIFAFLLQTLSEESKQVLRTLPNWDSEIVMNVDPYVLMYWIIKYHFVAFNSSPRKMKDAALGNLDNCKQGTSESLASFLSRWNDILKQMSVMSC